MRAVAIIVLTLTALAGVNAFAASFAKRMTYSTADCSGTATGQDVFPLDECVVQTGSTKSQKVTVVGSNVTVTAYTANSDCTGATGTGQTFFDSQCVVSGSTSFKINFPIASSDLSLYSITSYSDSGCGTVSDGPQYSISGTCSGQVSLTVSGGSLTLCQYSTSTCTGDSTSCNDIPTGTCISTDNAGVQYATNSAVGTAVTSVTAVMIAVTSLLLSL